MLLHFLPSLTKQLQDYGDHLSALLPTSLPVCLGEFCVIDLHAHHLRQHLPRKMPTEERALTMHSTCRKRVSNSAPPSRDSSPIGPNGQDFKSQTPQDSKMKLILTYPLL